MNIHENRLGVGN